MNTRLFVLLVVLAALVSAGCDAQTSLVGKYNIEQDGYGFGPGADKIILDLRPDQTFDVKAGPLVMLDGRRVTSREQWVKERRPELQALFQHYMYGTIPAKPAQMRVKILGEHRDFLGGKATLKLLTLETGPGAPATTAPPIR